MTITNYIIRILVACGLVMGFITSLAIGLGIKEDLVKDEDVVLSKCVFCLFVIIFLGCGYLLWRIK